MDQGITLASVMRAIGKWIWLVVTLPVQFLIVTFSKDGNIYWGIFITACGLIDGIVLHYADKTRDFSNWTVIGVAVAAIALLDIASSPKKDISNGRAVADLFLYSLMSIIWLAAVMFIFLSVTRL